MTNPTNSGPQIHYGEKNTQLKTQIFNYQLLLSMVYEMYIYEINLNFVNTKYYTFNLKKCNWICNILAFMNCLLQIKLRTILYVYIHSYSIR